MGEMAFITVAGWPKGWGRDQVVQAIVASTACDPYDAGLVASATSAPVVLGMTDLVVAKDVVRVLREERVPALAVSFLEVAELQRRMTAKRLVRAEGAPEPMYLAHPWRERVEELRGLRMAEVILLVRGRIPKFDRLTTTEEVDEDAGPETLTTTEMRGGLMEALDIYTVEGPAVRITGKFDFREFLGKQRGYTDSENMDKLCLRLGEEAPGAQLDLNFRQWRSPAISGRRPAGSSQLGAEAMRRDDTGAFDLYSALTVTMLRAMRRAREKRGG